MTFTMPPRSQVGYLDKEIAGEGQGVTLSDGDAIRYDMPVSKPAFPDISDVKSIRKYFHRVGFSPFPCWLYHPTKDPVLVNDQKDSMEYGVVYRETSADERARYGRGHMYDWQEGSEWRPTPFAKDVKFDPQRSHAGKTIVWPASSSAAMQDALIERLIPQVAASVAAALKIANPASPPSVDEKDWTAFQEFMAWKKAGEATREAVHNVIEANAPVAEPEPVSDEKVMWAEEAERLGVKVDGRWSLDRLKSEVEKAAA